MLHYKISLNNLDLSTVLVQNSFASDLNFFHFAIYFVCYFNNLTPCAEINQPSAKKIPQPGIASSYFGKRKQRYFCSSSTQVMNKYSPKVQNVTLASECT